jgi:integrase
MQLTNKHPKYTFIKDDVYYFSKAVPSDLQHHYYKPRVVISLKTKSSHRAATASRIMLSKLEDYWLGLRLKDLEVPAAHLLRSQATINLNSSLIRLSEALEIYLKVKGRDKGKLFFSHTKRAIGYLISYLGNRSLDQYSGADAAELRDKLQVKGLSTSSIQRNFGCINAVINFVIKEHGLACNNAFAGVYLPAKQISKKRKPVSIDSIIKLQFECFRIDDDLRHLVGLISDSGLRLAEATGLMRKDLIVDTRKPYLKVRPHSHRSLKTASSERIVPLVGAALWTAKRVLDTEPSPCCFPRYADKHTCNSNSASAALNKWIKTVCGKEAVIHGLRHSFRDRLRMAETPTEIIDQLGGWSLKTVGQSYGDGYQLEQLLKWMKMIEFKV